MPHILLFSEQKMAQQPSNLFQRFPFLVLKDAMKASKSEFAIFGELYAFRLVIIVKDQLQERAFMGLKYSGSFLDCIPCMMQSLRLSTDTDGDEYDLTAELCDIVDYEEVFQIQTAPNT